MSNTIDDDWTHLYYPRETVDGRTFAYQILFQDQIWVDSKGRIWGLLELQDSHLENLIRWLDGHAYAINLVLEDHSSHLTLKNTPLYKRLVTISATRLAARVQRDALNRFKRPEQVVKDVLDVDQLDLGRDVRAVSTGRVAAAIMKGIRDRGWNVVKNK